jgi:hypothetical protein
VYTCPYYPTKGSLQPGEKREFVEFPWPYYDLFGFKFPTCGGPVLRFFGEWIVIRGLRQSLKRGHTVFYFHPIDMSCEEFPKTGIERRIYWIVKGSVVERRIRHIFRELANIRKVPLRDALIGLL